MTVPNSPPSSRRRSWSGPFDLGRERPFADAGDVGLGDAEHAVDPGRPDADAGGGAGGDRVRGGDERIGAVVEVEQGRLGALEEDVLAVVEGLVDEQRGVADDRPQPLRVALVAGCDLVEVEPVDLVHALEPDVLLGERDLDLLAEDLRVEDVLDADADPRGLVGVAGADAAPRGADLELAEPSLRGLVDRDVPRHDQVRVAGEHHDRRVDPAGLELVELADQDLGVDDAAAADDRDLAGDDPARRGADLERLVADDDRVPGVRPALVTADHISTLRKQVDDLALAFVSPLCADDNGRWHAPSLPERAPVATGTPSRPRTPRRRLSGRTSPRRSRRGRASRRRRSLRG